jgi:glutathione S-transferase
VTAFSLPAPPFRLLGAERSYFTGKVRPALRAKRVHFEEQLSTREIYLEIHRRTGLMFLPVVVTPEDDTWQDTSDILDALDARFPEPPLFPSSPAQRIAAYLLELYADEFLILPAMHYRWTAPASALEARAAFAAVNGDPEAANRFADAISGSLPALGVQPATLPAVEAHLADLLAALESLFAAQPFLLGGHPTLADCALMGPLYAHLYLDVLPGPMLRERAPRTAHWIERMNHPDTRAFGALLPGDALHPALRGVLELVGSDAVPLLLDSLRAFEAWADARTGTDPTPPRAVGGHRTALRGIEFTRYTSSYTPWMAQRTLDAFAALGERERRSAEAALAGTGCEALLAHRPRHRLGKRRFQLVFA